MKTLAVFAILTAAVALGAAIRAQAPEGPKPPAAPLPSAVFNWAKLVATARPNGERRAVLDGATATLDNLHCHISTLKPGAVSGEPTLHLLEELIIVKEGTVEASIDGRTETAGPGAVIFFAARAVTRLRNAGDVPATYYVVSFVTPATPKN